MKKMKVYISGPMQGVENMNRETFSRVEAMLNELGFEAVNPHRFVVSTTYNGLLTDEEWITVDILALKHCDAIFMLPGWQDSEEAQREWNAAWEEKLQVYGFDLEA